MQSKVSRDSGGGGENTMSNTSTPKKTRRPVTAVRTYKIVRDAAQATGVASTDSVEVFLSKLKDTALEEAIAD